MSYYNRDVHQKFILRNIHSGAMIVIDTKEGAERLMKAMSGWKLAYSVPSGTT